MTQATSLILSPNLVDEVRNSMLGFIDTAVRPNVEIFKRLIKDLEVLEDIDEAWVVGNWLAVPKVSMRDVKPPLRSLDEYVRMWHWLSPYMSEAPCLSTLLWRESFKYYRYYSYNVYAFDATGRGSKVLLMRLAILGHLIQELRDAYKLVYNSVVLASADARIIRQLCNGCKGLGTDDALNCMTRNITNALRDFRMQLVNVVDRRVKWLGRRITLHNLIAGMVGRYVKGIQQVGNVNDFRDRDRASRYLGSYKSYVEYDGKVVRFTHPWHDVVGRTIPLLGGVEDGEKFVRIKLDLIKPIDLTLRSYGSWLIGFDKITRQPFSISLPYQCTVMPIHVCVEYALGVRDRWLRRATSEPVEVTEA
jgi:hypothetical protein